MVGYGKLRNVGSLEAVPENPRVGGSIPSLGTLKIKGLQLKAVTPFFICDGFLHRLYIVLGYRVTINFLRGVVG
jgi:hypothetical protein